MRRLVLLLALALAAGCTEPDPPPPPTAAVAEVRIPNAPPALTHGNDPLPPRPPGLVAQLAPEAAWPCEGDGTSGRRVQLIYAHTGAGNLIALRPSFEAIARRIEGTFLTSAREGGGERLVRFVTDAGCNLSIANVVLSANGAASFDQTIAELSQQGFNRPDRIYHAWVESSAYCGIGTVYSDDRPSGNHNEQFAQYSRSDRPCWNYAEAHEIVHNLGGVQNSAPNSTGGLHSRDEYDVMSYADGAPAGQMIQPFPCPDASAEDRLDCRDDDYFSVAPAPGSYLASHWNVADASALARSVGSTTSTTAPPTSTSSTSTTSTTVGNGETKTELTAPTRVTAGEAFTVSVRVTGECRPQGTVEIYVSGKLMSRQVLVDGDASVRLTILPGGAARPTIRADYPGSGPCAKSSDVYRPRVI